MNIYVGNLPFSTTEDELKDIFKEYGEVHSAKLIMDHDSGRPRGFGFIEMSENSARKAIAALNGAELEGKQITVNEARDRKTTRGGGGGGGDRNRNKRW